MKIFVKAMSFSLMLMGLTACSLTTIAPIEQLQKNIEQEKEKPLKSSSKADRDTVKQQPIVEYHCEQRKVVRVQPLSAKKNSAITVTFNRASYKLSPTVSSKGKKYSNIRWIWLETFSGKAMLLNTQNQVLATQCVRKKAGK